MKQFAILFLVILVLVVSAKSAFAQTPTPPTQVATWAGSPPCEGDFVECYGEGFAKVLLVGFTAIFGSIVGVRQKIFLLIFFLAWLLWFLPSDVFGFWYMVFTLTIVGVDMVRGVASD